jgi:MtN3 and saliva related transmembrane protein
MEEVDMPLLPREGGVPVNEDWLKKLPLGFLLPGVMALQGCASLGVHDRPSLLSPTLQESEVVGFVAGFGTTFAALPDLLAMLKRRSSAGMNPRMAGIMCVFQIAWVYYGLLIASRPVIVWNVVAIVINGLSVGAYLYFVRKERGQARRP